MKINGPEKIINKPANTVYGFLINTDNFGKLMPEQVKDWKSDGSSCSFKIEGMAEVNLKQENCIENKVVRYVGSGKIPFQFAFVFEIESKDDQSCSVNVSVEGDMNPFMQMMVERPIKNLVNIIPDKLATYL